MGPSCLLANGKGDEAEQISVANTRPPMKRSESSRALGKKDRQRGFTVVELITVIALAAIFAALAGPPFRDFIIQQRIRNAAYDLMSDITYARSEAVKR